jgi:1,4-alpha-glucan branching enzyme
MGDIVFMRPTFWKIFLFLSLLSATAIAADWRDSFFTDDSIYYSKLFSNGFAQRFRVGMQDCDQIAEAVLILHSRQVEQKFYQVDGSSREINWPVEYVPDPENFCWFETRVTGLDLNKPLQNEYLIAITSRIDGKVYYFHEYTNSLLPVNRLTEDRALAFTNWISLGPLGPTVVEDGGVFFKIWEPVSDRVDLFLNDGPAIDMFADKTDANDNARSHVRFLSDAKPGDSYYFKFVKNGQYENLEVANGRHFSEIKTDPMARRVISKNKGARINGYIDPQSIVVDPTQYRWKFDSNMLPVARDKNWSNWIFYQIWPLTFNPRFQNGVYDGGTLRTVVDKLDYLTDLGVTAIELLPIHEGRLETSWGYALDSFLAIENTYGTPDECRFMVDESHKRGLRVVFDAVINHVYNSLLREPLSRTVTKSKFYDGNTEWGPKPNFSNIMVRRWIRDALLALMREYHVDGFRFDMTPVVYAWNAEGYRLLQELNQTFKMVNPKFYSTAEELPDNVWISMPVNENGAGFDSQWNDKFKNVFEKNFINYKETDRWVDLNPLKGSLLGYSNQFSGGQEMHFGPPLRTVNYLGSHDFIGNADPIIRMVSPYMSTETVVHNTFVRVRPLEDPDDPKTKFRMVHNQFTHSTGKLAYGILFTKPGSILFFQGEELANDINLQNEWAYVAAIHENRDPTIDVDRNRYVRSHRMPWEYYLPDDRGELSFLTDVERNLFRGYYLFFKSMIQFRKEHPGINDKDAFNIRVDYNQSLMSYQIRDGEQEYFVVANFGNTREDYWIEFPYSQSGDWWKEIINSSAKQFGGLSDTWLNVLSNYRGRSNQVRVAPTTFMLFQLQKNAEINRTLYLMSGLNNWQAQEDFRLLEKGNGLYVVDFWCPTDGRYEFKLGTANWDVEVGTASEYPIPAGASGHMSYAPNRPNVQAFLQKGRYRFQFDLRSFEYHFGLVD